MLGKVTRINENLSISVKCWDDKIVESIEPIPCTQTKHPLKLGDTISFRYKLMQKKSFGVRQRIIVVDSINIIEPIKDEVLNSCFEDIAYNWKVDASNEDDKYFYITENAKQILSGRRCFVIGRKGSGKTAIRRYLVTEAKKDPLHFIKSLSFDNFPFNDLLPYSESNIAHKRQYFLFWKYVILSSIAQMMLENNALSTHVYNELYPLFGQSLKDTLSNNIKTWTGDIFSFNALIKHLNIAGNINRNYTKNESTLEDKVDILQKYIDKNMGENFKYSIVFDELDDGYADTSQREEYNSLLTSLFRAVNDVKEKFEHSNSIIQPVIFLRDDIYSQLEDTNTNKWTDWIINLNWRIPEILKMLTHRISISCGGLESLSPDTLFAYISSLEHMSELNKEGKSEKCNILRYIENRTLYRPRDFITWFIELAKNCINHNNNVIKYITVLAAESEVSKRMHTEFENELYGSKKIKYPKIAFDLLGIIQKKTFDSEELKIFYDYFDIEGILSISADDFLAHLFKFSIIGYIGNNNKHIFSFNNPRSELLSANPIVVNASLHRVLEVADSKYKPITDLDALRIRSMLESKYSNLLFYSKL